MTKGMLVNVMSPHPYLFWFTVGGPLLTKGIAIGPVAVAGFLASFYFLLVGSKMLLAMLTATSKSFMNTAAYSLIMRFLALALWFFGLLLLYEDYRYFS